MITALAFLATANVFADGVQMKFIASGATQKAGGYRPIRANLTDSTSGITKLPSTLNAAKFGQIKLGDKTFAVILDAPETGEQKLYVDSNGDGDLTNDPATTWTPRKQGEYTMYNGAAKVRLNGQDAGINLYKFDPKDPQRAQLKDVILFYTDFGYELDITMDGKTFKTFISGEPSGTGSVWIDRNGDGRQSAFKEMAPIGKPFNFTGTTYVLNVSNGAFKLDKASERLEMAPMPPDLRVGQKTLKFKAKATDGTEISFPETYKGKIVMLDFWATWCGPCIAELPNVKKAYEKYHDQGFEILGISFDQANMAEKLADFTKKNDMPWRQIYEGKFWETQLGMQFDVNAIPFVLLVDGDTGEILATVQDLRGEKIVDTIGKALAKKKGA